MARAALFFLIVAVSQTLVLILAASKGGCLPEQTLVLILAASDDGCLPEQCGNVTIAAPFGIVSGSSENGCAQLGFQVHCTGGAPYLGYYELEYGLQILDIFYGNASLLVSDVHKLGDFNASSPQGYHVPTANTASKIGNPFSISRLNRNLVFYNCTKAPVRERAGLVETVCRNNTFVRPGRRYDEPWDYTLEGCNATALTVRGPSTGEVNPSDYQELISDGFLLTWRPPPAAADW
ncbi:hypothetical protein ACQ4PT_011250 [Festuca glaucescens]